MKKLLVFIGIGGLISFVVLLSLLSGAANPLLNAQLSKITAQISQETHREIEMSSVDLRVFPRFIFEINHTQIDDLALPKGLKTSRDENTFIHLDQMRVQFNTWKALTSLGTHLELDQMTIENLSLYVCIKIEKVGRIKIAKSSGWKRLRSTSLFWCAW